MFLDLSQRRYSLLHKMRPPGTGTGGGTVMFADQIHHQPHHHRHPPPPHQNGHGPSGGGRRVQIVDSFYPPPPPPPNHHHHHQPSSAPHPPEYITNGHHPTPSHHRSEPPYQYPHHQQQQQPHLPVGSPPAQRCQCCPFGFHIDLGFVKFAEDVAAGKEQIQNWSSPAKKRARRLMASPSSDRTQLDMSSSDMANISSSYANESSMMSKSLDVDDLPEFGGHHQHTQFANVSSPYSNGHGSMGGRPRAPSVPITPQYPTQGILKNADWQHHQQMASYPIRGDEPNNYQQQQMPPISSSSSHYSHRHYVPPQLQHQSRFYEAHVQQQQQQHRRRYPLSMSAEQTGGMVVGSPPPTSYMVGSPLRTSTPRGANDDIQRQRPLHISTGLPMMVVNGNNKMRVNGSDETTATISAPSSPIPRASANNHQRTIAQSMAQLRKTPQTGMTTATLASKPHAHTSLSALSTMARNAFTNPPITTRRYYLEAGGNRRVLSPEPHLPSSMADGVVRSSNLQSRAFFHHQNNNNNNGPPPPPSAGRMPYRSRGAGSAPHIGPPSSFGGSSTLELGEFASVRRRRLDADVGGATLAASTLPSAHLVRSLSPPMHFPAPSSSSPSSGAGSLPRWPLLDQSPPRPSAHPSFSMANLEPREEVSEYYDEGTLKADKSKKKKKMKTSAQFHHVPVQTVPMANLLMTSGTQTPQKPAGKEIGISTDQRQHPKKAPTPPTPKKVFKEIGTSPDIPASHPISPTAELPFAGLIQFASIGVDTADLPGGEQSQKDGTRKNQPPAPPPKPSGPDLETELRRRRHKEMMGTLVAEFQYCLGHEPEHHPDHQPPLLEKARTFVEAQQQVSLGPETADRGVDAFSAIHQNSMSTSTSDLAKPPPTKVDAAISTLPSSRMVEIGITTEPRENWTVGVQTEGKEDGEEGKGQHLVDADTQTENGWLEAELGRKLAEAEAQRKEKRKRLSVERSTETDEEEAPDQFIMITCNKCEQRSSVASDELFEKIIAPEEPPLLEELKHSDESAEMDEPSPSLPTVLETVKEEESEFLSSHEEMKIPDLLSPKKEEEGRKKMAEEGEEAGTTKMHFELRPAREFKSVEMWRLVDIPEEVEMASIDEIGAEEMAKMEEEGGRMMVVVAQPPPKPVDEPAKIVVKEEEERREEKGKAPKEREIPMASATTPLASQMDQLLQGAKQRPSKQEEGGLVLMAAADEFDDRPELDELVDLDADRISIETDVQTVICVEPGGGPRSSSSASTKTPTTPTASSSNNGDGESAASARTEAIRKLLIEPPRQTFQRDIDSNRSYRSDKSKGQQLDLEYIADRHKSTDAQQQQSEPSTPCSSTQTKKALKETISLKKQGTSFCPAPGANSSNATFPPDPIPARIPRPKIARYSPNVALAETPDEEAEAADRLTPLRSEMRSLSTWTATSPNSSPRMAQRSLIFRTQIGGEPLEEEEEDLEVEGGPTSSSGSSKEQLPQDSPMEDDGASSTSSEGARTYEMSEDESAEFFELSAPLRDALETINDFLLQGAKTPTTKGESEQQNNQIEWAHKYAQHEWLKMATKKSANAELVEQFIDALECYSTQLMDTVINMTDQNGNTALHYAVSNENFNVVSVLLDSKVCRVDQMNKAGYSALMLGALCELHNETECAIMQRLFQMGNVNAKAVKHSQTALMLAASHGRVEATNLLLKCGADVNIQDVDGSTALMCAAEHGQKEIVKILLKQANIDASLTDCDNQTALSIAVENQHRDIGVLIYAHLNFSRLADSSGGVDNSVSI